MRKLRGALAVPLVVSISCLAAPARETGPATTAGSTKNFAPLGIRADAKAANQAVILGTDDRNGSTILALPTLQTKGLVDAMFVKLGGVEVAAGGSTPVKLSTEPNKDGSVQVGIYEELAGGTGSQWRAGVWVSAFVAASTLGKDLTDFSFSAASGGYIDGASASGLMAGGFLATMTGEKIDPTVTMTGIINPDGTIGPVGGIPEKFAAAIEKGKRKVGYPIGMRWSKSEVTGKDVDLVALAKAKGAEAIEIANVHEAYKLLTGKTLPEPLPVSEAEMALDDDTVKGIDAKYKVWQRKLASEWAALLQLQQSGRLPSRLLAMAALAQSTAERAEQLHKQGLIAGAYAKMLTAWVYAASATDTYDIVAKIQAHDLDGAAAAVASLDQLDSLTTDVFKKIGAIKPSTLGGHLLMISAFQAALRSWGFKMFARDSIGTTKELIELLRSRSAAELAGPEVAEAVVDRVAPTVFLIGQTVASSVMAAEELEFMTETSVNYMCSIPNIKRMSTSFQSAGAAGVNYFDTLLVEPAAKQLGLSLDQARVRIAMSEPNYLVAYMLSHLQQADGLPKQLRDAWGENSPQWNLMSLAGSELAYYNSSELIAKYYSLGATTDYQTGKVTAVAHDKAFMNMLASAERTARASARGARIATGSIPVQAKLAYQQATIAREGDIADKLDALSQFWLSSAYSQTAVMLARN
ncbi:MAG: peptidase lon domain protein [Myxococcales bacterium]|nr:peptidase lon domain protein [Myxococcales bacterium]